MRFLFRSWLLVSSLVIAVPAFLVYGICVGWLLFCAPVVGIPFLAFNILFWVRFTRWLRAWWHQIINHWAVPVQSQEEIYRNLPSALD